MDGQCHTYPLWSVCKLAIVLHNWNNSVFFLQGDLITIVSMYDMLLYYDLRMKNARHVSVYYILWHWFETLC